jgi:hypothetical protein
MNAMKWIVIIYLVVNIILALIPALLDKIQSLSASLGGTGSILLSFLFDPTEYVWKWIVGLLLIVVILFNK